MSLVYKVVSKQPGGIGKASPKRYYPVITRREVVDLQAICHEISSRSTLTAIDVTGVLQAFIDLIPEYLEQGSNVHLDNFGVFSLHAKAEGVDDPTKVTARNIKEFRMKFLPSKRLKKRLQTFKARKAG